MKNLSRHQQLAGHTDRVWAVAWSPKGDMLASCSGDKTVRIWSRRPGSDSWNCTAVLEDAHMGTIRSCSWSPNGRLLATAGFDAKTAVWQLQGGIWEQVSELEGHENEVKCVAWNPNGSLLATCGRDRTVWIWESIPGNEYECVEVMHQGHSQDVKHVTWHPSGELLASASYDNTIKLWVSDGDEWTCSQTLGDAGQGHSSTVWAACFDASGDRLVSCSDDLTLRVWALARWRGAERPDWRCAAAVSGYHGRCVYSVHWSGVNGMIATGDGENCVRVFAQDADAAAAGDLAMPEAPASGEGGSAALPWTQVACMHAAHSQDVNCVQWHPTDGALLASAGDDGFVHLWRLSD